MSRHAAEIFIHDDLSVNVSGFLEELGFTEPEYVGQMDYEDACSSKRHEDLVCVGLSDGWTIAFNQPDFFGAGYLPDATDLGVATIWPDSVERALLKYSVGSRAFADISEGSTGTYAFTWYVNGVRKRMFLDHSGGTILDEGVRLQEEIEAIKKSRFGKYKEAPIDTEQPYLGVSHESFIANLRSMLCECNQSVDYGAYRYARCPGMY